MKKQIKNFNTFAKKMFDPVRTREVKGVHEAIAKQMNQGTRKTFGPDWIQSIAQFIREEQD